MQPQTIGLAILLLGVLAAVGMLIRASWGLTQRLFLPVSIIAGFLGLILGPQILGRIAGALGADPLVEGGLFGPDIMAVWTELPGLLISVVFATLFLGSRIPSPKRAVKLLGPQLSLGVTFASGQYVIGLLLVVLLLAPLFGVGPMFGALIEIGFEGGHGTAAGMAPVMTELGFEEGGDLALAMATVGILTGVIVGVVAVNWAARKGHATALDAGAQMPAWERRGLYAGADKPSAGRETTRTAAVETLTLHVGAVALAVLIQVVLDRFDSVGLIDRGVMERIQGLSLDFLIIAALATLSLTAIADNFAPFAILAIAGIVWNVFVLFVLAPRFIRPYWFERGLGDFGQSMGVTATGLMLMRMADPEAKTPAYEFFGYKQLVFEPFFGGGLITAASIPLIVQLVLYPLLVIMAALLLAAVLTGLFYFGRSSAFDLTAQDRAGG